MPRLSRIHVNGGLYYVVHRCSARRALFECDADYAQFELVCAQALQQFRAHLLAFRWEPEAIHLAIQVTDIPVGHFMRAVLSRYVQLWKRPRGTPPGLFERRHQALLIDKAHLLSLIRYIHRLPRAGSADPLAPDFLHSSHRAYLNALALPWVATHIALNELSPHASTAVRGYVGFMRDKTSIDPWHFSSNLSRDPRVVGDGFFLSSLPRELSIKRTTMTLQGIIDAVLLQEGLTSAELTVRPTHKTAALARALITFHAVQRGIASYTQVARILDRTIPCLQHAVKRYRGSTRYSHLFDLAALRYAGPLLSLGSGASRRGRSRVPEINLLP